MSLWKFLNGKHKKERITQKDENSKDGSETSPTDGSPAFDRQRNRHQMSVSRSGRYKQKHRKRSGILDNPDFVDNSASSESTKENVDPPSKISDDIIPYLVKKDNLNSDTIVQTHMEISAL